jgi:hypothetical protein
MRCTYAFAWTSLLEGELTADRLAGGSPPHLSLLIASIPRRALFLQPHLYFPLAWNSPELARFLDAIEPDCPFRFRDQYFYRLLPNRRGQYTQARKLKKGWRGDVDSAP